MGLFTKKKSSFTNTNVNLGRSPPRFLRPTKEELEDISGGPRMSVYPHFSFENNRGSPRVGSVGRSPPRRQKSRQTTQKKGKKKRIGEGERLRRDFVAWRTSDSNDFIGFAREGGYDSQSHLGRNLNFKIDI